MSSLHLDFSKMLRKAPVLEFSSTDEIYLVLDGTYFPNDICLVVYRNFHLRSTQLFYRMANGEHFEDIVRRLAEFIESRNPNKKHHFRWR